MSATERPWRTEADCEHQQVIGPDGYMVADCAIFSLRKGAPTSARCSANAVLIVKAVNCHDELVEALDDLLALHNALHNHPIHAKARAALRRARGEQP